MVRTTILLSVVVAFVASVSAAPKGSLIDIDGGDYIGTGNIYAQGAASDVVSADNLQAHDILQNVDIASDDDDMMGGGFSSAGVSGGNGNGNGNGGSNFGSADYEPAASGSGSGSGSGSAGHSCNDDCHHGLLSHLLKRKEAAPAKKAMVKQMMNGKKVAMRKNMARKN